MIRIAVCVVVLCLVGVEALGTVQSAAVKGQLVCNGKPAANVKVKLYDEDTTDLDDLMQEGVTDSEGRFELSGKETEITSIDPKLNVYHDCNDETVPCLKKFSIYIPKDYVNEGAIAHRTFDAGVLNLSGRFSGEGRDCLN
ncbi:Transthyretin-like family-containing protein [Aphelenchoides besseyi]|nr:Transthyretin-like family-containing protein [Aphelenchoides besseyi]KAI6218766.1 Transthyretin-like family-containing protein [Aphelenchoides besseyi]